MVLALILVVIFGDIGKPKYDYEAILRAYTPCADSYNLPYAFGEVMDKYLEDATWDVDEKEDSQAVVTVSGTLKGFGEKVEFTYALTPNPEDSGNVKFKNDSVTVNSEKSSWEGANNWFLLALYSAYDDGDEEIADLSGLLIALGIHEPELTETYINDYTGIAFKYPKAWQEPSAEMKKFLSSSEELFGSLVFSLTDDEQYLPQFSSMMGIYQYSDPDIQTAAEQLLGDDDEFLDDRGFDPDTTETSVTEVGGIPARVILMNGEDGSNTRIYMYIAGDKVYTIFFMRHGKESEQLEHCFDAVMDSYTVTVPEPTPTPEPTPAPTTVLETSLDITFRGSSVVDCYDCSQLVIEDTFGKPDSSGMYATYGVSYYDEGVCFFYDGQTWLCGEVTAYTPSAIMLNGSPMSNTKDGIISAMGTPDESDEERLAYYYDEVYVEVCLDGGSVKQINIVPRYFR